ncbi:MAG: hypothetical protein IMW98_05895 [Firmicutes bacterium]|nr:hypothetical protein [Bacillota bacterium]
MAWLLLGARIGLIGVERLLLKALGRGASAAAATFLFFALGAAALTPWGLAQPLAPPARAAAVMSGLVFSVAFLFYLRSLALDELSRVAPLGGLADVFTLALAAALDAAPVGAAQALGTLLILGGVAALEGAGWRGLMGLARRRSGVYMVAYAALLAAERLIDQRGGAGAPPVAYTWTMFTTVTAALAAWLTARGGWGATVALLRRRPLPALGSAATNVGSYAALVALLDEFPVTVLEPVTSLSLLVSAYLGRAVYGERLRGRILPALAVAAGSALVLWR